MIRRLPLVVGIAGGSLLLANRLAFSPELLASQSRSDALGVILSALLILTGLLWQQIQPLPPKSVEMAGEQGLEMLPELPEILKLELGWATSSLLKASPARSVVIWAGGHIVMRRGVLASADFKPGTAVEPGSILKRVLTQQKSVYLVDLKLFPARAEFGYVPENSQCLLCQPVGDR
ncbi:MAG: cofactor assembly of complex C subunit B, partial [Cyanobacteria bacterium J06639_1]